MLTKEQSKNYLEQIKKDLEANSSDSAIDFVGDYSLDYLHYLGDAFSEFADNNISVYCSDQFAYYEEHPEESESALLSLYNGDDIADMIKKEGLYSLCCHAAVCAQYEETQGELYNDEENIKKLLIIRHLLKNDIFIFDKKQIDDLLSESEDSHISEGWQLIDLINSKLVEIIEEGE